MADWSLPVLTSLYTDALNQLKARDDNSATMFSTGSSTGQPVNAIKFDLANGKFLKWDGTNWVEATAKYAFQQLQAGSALITGSFDVNGAANFTGSVSIPDGNTGNAASKKYVGDAIAAASDVVKTFNGRNGTVTLQGSDVTGALGYTPVTPTGGGASGTWSINITGSANYANSANSASYSTTVDQSDNSDHIATTAFVRNNSATRANGCIYLNSQTITENYTVPVGQNAGSFGPINIGDGVRVTVPDGARWTIV